MYEAIKDAIHREMDLLDEKYSTAKTPMNAQDLEHIDRMAHALKCLATYEAMLNAGDRTRRYEPRYDYRRY